MAAAAEGAAAEGAAAGCGRMTAGFSLGVGIGWRPEIDLTVPRLAAATGPGVDFVEVVADERAAV